MQQPTWMNLVIYSETCRDNHLCHINSIFQWLRAAGLTAKLSKCQYAIQRCVYLGHVVGNGTVCPEVSKIDAVQLFPTPRTKSQVRAFLGIRWYYQKLVPNYVAVAAALSDLTKKSAPNQCHMDPQCDQVFQKLRQLLCSSPILKSLDFTQPFLLQTDA